MSTNVPAPVFGPNGFETPPELDIFNGRMADLNAAFGGNLNLDVTTPQGQMGTSEAALIALCYDIFLKYTNQTDPTYADGRMQDALGRIYFLNRFGPRPTVVEATVTGAGGTIIPAGYTAKSTDGNIYASLGIITIGAGGTATGFFANIVDGPIPCPAGTLTQIYRGVTGWDTITNSADGVLGRNTEARSEFEARRVESVAGNARAIVQAVRGAVLAVPDVLDAYVTENDTNASASIGGVTLPANSIYVAAVGGLDADVAQAIWSKKSPGCSYYAGNTSVVVEDTDGYEIPYPSYTVKFERPADLRIYMQVTITNSAGVPANAEDLINAAVLAAFNGQDGGVRARIGATVYASRFYAAVAMLGTWARIVDILVGTTSPGAADLVTVNIDEVPTLADADITVVLA